MPHHKKQSEWVETQRTRQGTQEKGTELARGKVFFHFHLFILVLHYSQARQHDKKGGNLLVVSIAFFDAARRVSPILVTSRTPAMWSGGDILLVVSDPAPLVRPYLVCLLPVCLPR